jgi:hypothetical protein
MEGEDAVREMAGRERCVLARLCDDHVLLARPARPTGGEAGGVQDLPAMGIGDRQRQAAIGGGLVRLVHPAAAMRSRADVQPPPVLDEAFQKQVGHAKRLAGA